MGDAPLWKWIVGGATPLAAVPGVSPYYELGKDKKSDGGSAAADTQDIGNVSDVGSVESQAAARRLARMSKYFTSPTGVMGEPTGSSGVF